jgi:hypothetical protein
VLRKRGFPHQLPGTGSSGSGLVFVEIGRLVVRQFERVAALDQAEALGEKTFEFDRADFRAILLVLGLVLAVFIVAEFTLPS